MAAKAQNINTLWGIKLENSFLQIGELFYEYTESQSYTVQTKKWAPYNLSLRKVQAGIQKCKQC